MTDTTQTLNRVVQTVELVARTHVGVESRRLAASAAFAELDALTTRAITNVKRDWNYSHADTSRLPVDVFVACMEFLALPDRLKATHICSSWRRTLVNAPCLWKDLDLTTMRFRHERTTEVGVWILWICDLLLGYAVNASVRLKVNLGHQPSEADILLGTLKLHMHHIQHLEIDVRCLYQKKDIVSPMCMAAPILETLVVTGNSRGLASSTFLGGHAPKLRLLDIRDLNFPAACPALKQVSVLHIDSGHLLDEHRKFWTAATSPCSNLSELHVHGLNLSTSALLYPIPSELHIDKLFLYGISTPSNISQSRLQTILTVISAIRHVEIPTRPERWHGRFVYDLIRAGFYDPYELSLSSSNAGTSAIVLRRANPLHPALVGSTCTVWFSKWYNLRDPLRLATWADYFGYHSAPVELRNIQELSLYTGTSSSAELFQCDSIVFPALRILRLRCDNDTEWSLFDPDSLRQCRVLLAPALESLRLEAAGNGRHTTVPPHILALIIRNHLDIYADMLPELFVDTAAGVYLMEEEDGGAAMDVLESYVSRIVT
ncbi:hypothetical protein EXIGLDRAFT_761416 [Exidia glandulosa HHB12029]|uniref:F-box domain-containing protein n=1 Tax=Exidia glandulosa HHB12029 TaxID=1314781 RepID=A0A165NKB0_EXIGL|nr:hypothetical protein EXIGLDRAFT_761416 [Exidia glandulosa HHB12029]